MGTTPERRHSARLTIPPHLSGPGLEAHEPRLCDLSPTGARIEHFRPLPDWSMCLLALPQALGGLRLQGNAIWSRAVGRKQIAKGEKQVYYQSGLTFSILTPDQREGLTAALEILQAAQAAPPPAGPTGTANDRGGATRSMAKQPDRRHLARLVILSQLGSFGLEDQEVRLVALSLEGARVEHLDPLHFGLWCLVDLPPALGHGTFRGRIVWSKLRRTEQSLEGEQRRYFQSGLTWARLTPGQLDALTAALVILKATQMG